MTIDADVFVRRQKLRRKFETAFHNINTSIREAAKSASTEPFFVKYSNHLLDRAIQRDIDEEYVFQVLSEAPKFVKEINEFLFMEPLPEIETQIDPNKNYRPLRLELTDGNLWLGFTVDRLQPGKNYSLKCRMAFVNNKRLKGKISTKVINIK